MELGLTPSRIRRFGTCDAGGAEVGRFRNQALTLVLMGFFAVFLAGQFATGLAEYNELRRQRGEAPATVAQYFRTGHPWEALFENWESEFLQMAVFVLLTTVLVQRDRPNHAVQV
jgi:hypothetical protein